LGENNQRRKTEREGKTPDLSGEIEEKSSALVKGGCIEIKQKKKGGGKEITH